ncbi:MULTISPECIES: DUF937 domain-containing protein [unclassified Leucobacter]|uniref:DUF937 domain-containing protein n=1 Tax=unclassified Leucobacter TaxID=2621730 RepID=UPI00165E40AD|nr:MULTISPECIES: DUF937 domain-containing protein [unclassified Leucobacter]MBC9927873.1 DUF937 domain-containing protein [Leucobacter sp. cx-169]
MNLDDILKNIPVSDIAEKLGVDQSTAEAAIQQAVPALLGGMTVNAQSSEGAQKLESALAKHQTPEAKIDLNAIDTEDGEKIVGHVFGEKKGDVVAALGAQADGGGMGDIIGKLLPMLAPIVMGLLANSMSKGNDNNAQAESAGGGIGDLLGGLLGGGDNNSSTGGGLGDLLGGLLGGGNNNSGGGLGDLLGGLLGGGKK